MKVRIRENGSIQDLTLIDSKGRDRASEFIKNRGNMFSKKFILDEETGIYDCSWQTLFKWDKILSDYVCAKLKGKKK